MIFVASLAAGLPNAAVLHVRSFTKGVSHESTTHSSSAGHRFCIFRSLIRRAKRVRDAGLLQQARAVDGKVVTAGRVEVSCLERPQPGVHGRLMSCRRAAGATLFFNL